MEDQYLFLSDTTCFKHLKCSDLVSDLRLYLSQEDRSRTLKRRENKAKVIYLDHIYKEMIEILRHGRNPTLEECCEFYKVKKGTMEDILKDLKNVKSSDELKSFKPPTLPFKKFAKDKYFHIKDLDNMMESKLSSHTEPGKSLNIGDEVFDCEYENLGIKFRRSIKRISVELCEYVYKSISKTDFECKLKTEDYECLW